jgi:hypothetical protein
MRGFGALALGLSARPALGGTGDRDFAFDEHVLDVPGEKLARRCLLLVPLGAASVRGVVVLFHGLGETGSEALGIRAWADRYGLLDAARRLAGAAPMRSEGKPVLLTDERMAELREKLANQPFQGFAVACPFTPNVFRQPSTAEALDRYSGWMVDGVLPEIRRRLALPAGPGAICVDGVSLGGYVSLEVFLRRPDAFGAVGALQAAVGVNLADNYAARFRQAFDRVGERPLRIASSSWDPERAASDRLVKALRARNVPTTVDVSPGGHDQRFLREVGTLELLYHYDRILPRLPPHAP